MIISVLWTLNRKDISLTAFFKFTNHIFIAVFLFDFCKAATFLELLSKIKRYTTVLLQNA